ncbi:lipopolysaccharide heptosyltransferase II [bacterium]|nr:lipopolysaccharide heptosyltransferase II [bacterium]
MPNSEPQESERILVLRFSSFGDILLTAPALRALRSRFPKARIDFLCSSIYAELAAALPGVDNVLEFDKSKGFRHLFTWLLRLCRTRYSLLIDLQNSLRSVFLRLFTFPVLWTKSRRYRFRRFILIRLKKNLYPGILPIPLRYMSALESFGCEDDGRGLELHISEARAETLQKQFQSRGVDFRRAVVLCPGARHDTKRWPREKWVDLARSLLNKDFQVLFLGSADEQSLIRTLADEIGDERVFSFTDLTFIEAAVLTKSARCLVSNDSGTMHLAAAVQTPVVALFGPTVEEFGFFPFRANAEVLHKELYCRPCSAMGTESCPEEHFKCMLDISVDEVFKAVLRRVESVNSYKDS